MSRDRGGRRDTLRAREVESCPAGALLPYLMLDHGPEEEDAIRQTMRWGLRSAELLEWGLNCARPKSI